MPKGYWVAKANILDDEKLLRYGKQADKDTFYTTLAFFLLPNVLEIR